VKDNYSRDKLGRIVAKSETIDGVTNEYGYTYDPAGRLIETQHNGTIATFSYDENSNRIATDDVVAIYDTQDRLLSYGDESFSYTPNGEILNRISPAGTTTYSYDDFGTLIGATLPSTTISYVLDPTGRRIGKKINGVLQQGFLYQSGLEPIAELDSAGAVKSRFVYGSRVNVPDYMIKEGIIYRFISDHLGSPRLIVNATTGAITQRLDYDSFGNIIQDTNPGFQPFGFAGGIYDLDTKLTQFGVREYDPKIGRWTSKDPIGFAGGDTNLYGYVVGDPINLFDLNGLLPGDWIRSAESPAPADLLEGSMMNDSQSDDEFDSGALVPPTLGTDLPELIMLGGLLSPSRGLIERLLSEERGAIGEFCSKFKSTQQRQNLEGLKNTLKKKLTGNQRNVFKQEVEASKTGEQFQDKETLHTIFEWVKDNVKP